MSWSTSSMGIPRSTTSRSRCPERDRFVRVESGCRLVEQQQLRPCRQGSGDGHHLALALGELGRQGVGELAEREPLECFVDRLDVADLAGEELLDRLQRRRVTCRDREVLAHGEVVEQLGRLPRPGETAQRTYVRLRSGDISPVDADRSPMGHEPRDGVDERGLAGAVRADQADQLVGFDLEIDLDHGVHAAERDRDVAGGQHRRHGSAAAAEAWVGIRRDSGRSLLAASAAFFLSCLLPVRRARHAVRVLDQGDDQEQATEQQHPVAGDAEDRLEEVGHEAFGGDQATDRRHPRPS